MTDTVPDRTIGVRFQSPAKANAAASSDSGRGAGFAALLTLPNFVDRIAAITTATDLDALHEKWHEFSGEKRFEAFRTIPQFGRLRPEMSIDEAISYLRLRTPQVIRPMAAGEVQLRDWWRIIRREFATGLVLGSVAIIGLTRILVWQALWKPYGEHPVVIAVTVALSLVGVVLFGTISGSMLPFILRRAGLDPASASLHSWRRWSM